MKTGSRDKTILLAIIGILAFTGIYRIVNLSTESNYSKIIRAASKDRMDIVADIVDKGVDLNAKNNAGYVLLHWASINGNVKLAQFLVARGADINARTEDGKTPLHLAAENCRLELSGLLIAKGAFVNAVDNDGQTPLHKVAYHGHVGGDVHDGSDEVGKLLVEHGADIDARDKKSKTPLQWAYYRSDPAGRTLARYLVSSGARKPGMAIDGIDHPDYFGKESLENVSDSPFIETDVDMMFTDFPEHISVPKYGHQPEKQYKRWRLWRSRHDRRNILEHVYFTTRKDFNRLWINNGLTEDVTCVLDNASRKTVVPASSIVPLVVDPGVVVIKLTSANGKYSEMKKLNLWGAASGRDFIYATSGDEYHIEMQVYKAHSSIIRSNRALMAPEEAVLHVPPFLRLTAIPAPRSSKVVANSSSFLR